MLRHVTVMKAHSLLLAPSLVLASLCGLAPHPALATAPPPRFGPCGSGPRITCVVDGDTFWVDGTKVRIADINTPETSQPSCAREAKLGHRATQRLIELLNGGPFALEVLGRDTDRYGRALRIVVRDGQSLGAVLEAEGLAEHWRGRRGDWCTGAV